MDFDDHRARLRLLEGLVLALARRGDVERVVSDAEGDTDTLRAVGELLDIGPEPAQAVLDLQLSRMSRERTAAIVYERDVCPDWSSSPELRSAWHRCSARPWSSVLTGSR